MDSAAVNAVETGEGLEGLELPRFKQRLGIPPQNVTLERAFLFHRARALDGRRADEAIGAYRAFIEIAPDEPVGYARLASIYERHDDHQGAADVYVALAEMYAAAQRWERAAAAYARAADLVPTDVAVLGALRDSYIKLGQGRPAAEVQARLDAVVHAGPNGNGAGSAVAELASEESVVMAPPPEPRRSVPKPAPPVAPKQPPAVSAQLAGAAPYPPAPAPPPVGPGQPPVAPVQSSAASAHPVVAPTHPVPPSQRPPVQPEIQPPAVDGSRHRVARARNRPLGQVFLDEGIVSREQLERAIQMQQRSGGHLGRILTDLGVVTEQQMA
ncbi:MAG TPA: hypothetical protein VI007_02425, partial [bacterium]